MYVAHYAPHLPLQAPADRVEKCRDRYKVGYDVLRKQRFDRLKELKFISDEMDYPVYQKNLAGNVPPGERLPQSNRNSGLPIWQPMPP